MSIQLIEQGYIAVDDKANFLSLGRDQIVLKQDIMDILTDLKSPSTSPSGICPMSEEESDDESSNLIKRQLSDIRKLNKIIMAEETQDITAMNDKERDDESSCFSKRQFKDISKLK
ncbi:hypothetical protein AC249_AIPGENE12207 [Exaiptasia diaphana]|nr:hypothetical protein AC249_AIPGENE12207 [Exaiptasia diaphana]